jgi:3-isopropylmalate/(R)-2-methylmalate dehydratase large subunit
MGTDAGTGYFIEISGKIIHNMSMEGIMTICNMSIEMGARGGMIAADQITFDYLEKTNADTLKGYGDLNELKSDSEACFDAVHEIDGNQIDCTITFGTNPGMAEVLDENIPSTKNNAEQKALNYMGLEGRTSMDGLEIQHVFIGSCTNGRFEDFELASRYVKGRKKAPHVRALLVPGSNKVLSKLREKRIDKIFEEAGFELREPGCSACLAMNGDSVPAGEYCVSTSNRNFEGRQGKGARTILASPVVAAISAIEGKITHPKEYELWKN